MPSKITRHALVRDCQVIAPGLDQALAEKHGQRVGFVLMLFDFANESGDGSLAYVSNAERAGMRYSQHLAADIAYELCERMSVAWAERAAAIRRAP